MKKFGRKPGFPSKGMFKQAPAKRSAANVADEILEFLGDSEVHDLKELANAVGLPKEEAEKVLDFLIQTGLVKKGARITNLGSNFLKLPVE
jgi:DNA-binding IclR family transcriptional regulator